MQLGGVDANEFAYVLVQLSPFRFLRSRSDYFGMEVSLLLPVAPLGHTALVGDGDTFFALDWNATYPAGKDPWPVESFALGNGSGLIAGAVTDASGGGYVFRGAEIIAALSTVVRLALLETRSAPGQKQPTVLSGPGPMGPPAFSTYFSAPDELVLVTLASNGTELHRAAVNVSGPGLATRQLEPLLLPASVAPATLGNAAYIAGGSSGAGTFVVGTRAVAKYRGTGGGAPIATMAAVGGDSFAPINLLSPNLPPVSGGSVVVMCRSQYECADSNVCVCLLDFAN